MSIKQNRMVFSDFLLASIYIIFQRMVKRKKLQNVQVREVRVGKMPGLEKSIKEEGDWGGDRGRPEGEALRLLS